jgi:thiol-disulfide isomerase/thioredoxin
MLTPLFLTIEQGKDQSKISEIKKAIKEGKNIFILLHWKNCGHCQTMLPEWRNLQKQQNIANDILIVDVEKDYMDALPKEVNVKNIVGYPTLRFIKKDFMEDYEQSNITNKNRKLDSFVEWIKSKNQYSSRQYGGKTRYKKRKVHKKTRKNKNIPKCFWNLF